jgi:hypothetical protein
MMMGKLESEFQGNLVKEIEGLLTDCMVLVKPGYYIQGFPDLLILYKNRWAILECKKSDDAAYQKNQKWWLAMLNEMGGYAAMIEPQNRKEILDEMVRSFES